VNRAAERLGLAQPIVTRRIQRLEAALGVELLDRKVRPMVLTVAGIQALGPCRAVLQAIAELHAVTRTEEPAGDLWLGIAPALADLALPGALTALRQRYPGRRLVALFEPRSLTAGRHFFFEPYREAFAGADRVLFAPIFHNGRLAPEERLDFSALAEALTAAGVRAEVCPDNAGLLRQALEEARDGSVLVTMSSGSFDGMPHRLVEALNEESP